MDPYDYSGPHNVCTNCGLMRYPLYPKKCKFCKAETCPNCNSPVTTSRQEYCETCFKEEVKPPEPTLEDLIEHIAGVSIDELRKQVIASNERFRKPKLQLSCRRCKRCNPNCTEIYDSIQVEICCRVKVRESGNWCNSCREQLELCDRILERNNVAPNIRIIIRELVRK